MSIFALPNMKNMKQKQAKLGTTSGSFINWMMSSNSTIPQIGMGATELHWSDRTPWEVIAIDNDGKGCTIRQMDVTAHPDAHKIGMGHQAWLITSNEEGHTRKLRWRHNAWRYKTSHYRITEQWEIANESNRQNMSFDDYHAWRTYTSENKERFTDLFKLHYEWHKMSIIFGNAEYHYDWEF